MTSALATMLQLALSLILAVQANPSLPEATKTQALTLAREAIQIASTANVAPQQVMTADMWPTNAKLVNAEYIDRNGARVKMTGGAYYYPGNVSFGNEAHVLQLESQYTSFGDMTGDGVDDAMVILKTIQGQNVSYNAELMMNNRGTLQPKAQVDLGDIQTIYSHQAVGNVFALDMKSASAGRSVVKYVYDGTSLVRQ